MINKIFNKSKNTDRQQTHGAEYINKKYLQQKQIKRKPKFITLFNQNVTVH